jgi:hypothetical protein
MAIFERTPGDNAARSASAGKAQPRPTLVSKVGRIVMPPHAPSPAGEPQANRRNWAKRRAYTPEH